MGFRVNSAGKGNQAHFAKVTPVKMPPRSAFDRSFPHKTTINEGYIYPIGWLPILPGDTISWTVNSLIRLATPIFPYMDSLYADFHGFFVPNRLLWSHWEQFQGAQVNPGDSVDYEIPSLDDATHAAGFSSLSIFDYFGLPTKVTSIPQERMPIALPFRAYNKIINDWYRDEDLQSSLTVDTSDGPDVTAYTLFKCNRRKDYFTSARPWPQKGSSVTLPIGTSAPVVLSSTLGVQQTVKLKSDHTNLGSGELGSRVTTSALWNSAGSADVILDLNNTHYTDLSAATANTINQLREAIVLQQILELDARSGTRYVEALLARFGVVSPDFRLQRAEYIGGQTIDINVNPVAQTGPTDVDSPQGNLAAFAVGRGKAGMHYSATEHGQMIIMLSIRADTTYQQQMRRDWTVRSRWDLYEPMQANLGEQAILAQEMLCKGDSTDDDVWGYQERWADQRFMPGFVTGAMRSNYTGTLDSWHLAIDQGSTRLTLSSVIPESPPVERIVAVQDEPHFIVDMWNRVKHVRVMPIYSNPGLFRL